MESFENGLSPEIGDGLPTAGGGEVEGGVGGEDPGGGDDDDVDVGVPEEKVAEGLDGDDEAGLAVGLAGAQAKPGGEGGVSGETEMADGGGRTWRKSGGGGGGG